MLLIVSASRGKSAYRSQRCSEDEFCVKIIRLIHAEIMTIMRIEAGHNRRFILLLASKQPKPSPKKALNNMRLGK